jgi:transposase InsO family protein
MAPLGDQLAAKEFLDLVSLDIVGPLPVTERGNKYLLTFVDHFTRFCEAVPIAKQDTETIAREFVTKIVTQFGDPKRLLTDTGANFTSALLQETCKLLKIQKLQTMSYKP